MTERLNGAGSALELSDWLTEVQDIGSTMKATSACGLGMAAPNVTDSLMKYFPEQVESHIAKK
tara:strand:+ start:46 stop:234 length:189 start_codon:yes stop_codon:yes gene_type:complete